MKRAISGKLAKKIDTYSIDNGMPSLVLMERAALKAVGHIEKIMQADGGSRIAFVCSMGNNGADGIAVARMIADDGYECLIFLVGDMEHATDEFNVQLNLARYLNIPICFFSGDIHASFFDEYTVIVDALFGIGLSRDIEGEYKKVIECINASVSKVVSVDIPSGINSASGQIMGAAIHADVTVTFGYAKLGQMLYPGKEYTGRLFVEQIGFLPYDFQAYGHAGDEVESAFYFADEDDFKASVPVRARRSNKGNYGKPLIIAGSKDMTGAAFMSGLAAYRTGAGVVTVLTHESIDEYIKSVLPEAIVKSYGAQPEAVLENALAAASVIVLGPGLSVGELSKRIVKYVLKNAQVPVVADADALNIMAENTDEWLGEKSERNREGLLVITPHVGEMSRLTGRTVNELAKDIPYYALEFAKHYGVYCVLKDAVSAAASPENELFITTCGNPGMATAGAGDVLTGILAAVNAWTNASFFERLAVGVQLHAMAGDCAAKKLGEHSLMARDIIDSIPGLLR